MNYGEPIDSHVSFLDWTVTPFAYRRRIDLEFSFNSVSLLLCFCLLVFVRFNGKILDGLKSTIVFVTGGAFVLNLPMLGHQIYMIVRFYLDDSEPAYPILVCSVVKLLSVALQTSAQVLPFTISVYRYRTLVLKKSHSTHFVFSMHTSVTCVYLTLALLVFPLGEMSYNRVCAVFRFSRPLEVVRVFVTMFFNVSSIALNCLILRFVKHYQQNNTFVQSRLLEVTRSLLFQSLVPVVVSLPLLLSSFYFHFGLPVPVFFSETLYATTYLDPILMPLSSVLGIRSTRKELFRLFFCCFRKERQVSVIEKEVSVVLQ